MISIMMVCLTFSSGMPIMYFVGFMYFSITFIVNKLMLIKYYQKTNSLSRVTPNFSLEFLNIGILIHMITGCIMFTNPSLFQSKEPPKKDLPKFNFLFHTEPFDVIDKMEDSFEKLFY